jgi:bleomycin hydrolase
VEVPDNFSNGAYYNLPINEMIESVELALNKGYTVLWDADVSNDGFNQKIGLALNLSTDSKNIFNKMNPDATESVVDEKTRQKFFENLVTQDDHLMHIVGIEKSKEGKTFFIVKNSWGESAGPYKGYIHVSESYFALNTISLVLPKAALNKALLDKLK